MEQPLSSFKIKLNNMAINKNYRLQLARLLKLYTEVAVEDGTVLISESDDNELKIGDEVFVESEEGLTPAPDKEYVDTTNNRIIVVVGGTVTEIREKETTIEPAQENMDETSENGEDANGNESANGADATAEGQTENQDNEMETLKAENEALKAKVAQLEATVSDLEDQIAAYKAKEEETTAPAADEAEKFSKQSTGNKALDKKLAAAKAILSVIK